MEGHMHRLIQLQGQPALTVVANFVVQLMLGALAGLQTLQSDCTHGHMFHENCLKVQDHMS